MRGFSVVELVVATAIAGVLGTVAWGYMTNSVRKAKVSQAKTILSGLYEAEQTFRGEHEIYTSNLSALGLQLQGRVRYNIGFQTDWPPPPGVPIPASPCNQICPTAGCAGFSQWTCDQSALANVDAGHYDDCDDATFSAMAHAHLDPTNPGNVDPSSLYIDHNKKLTECGSADPCTPAP